MDPDGDIMIHGLKDGVRRGGDWAQGCIGVTAEEMDEIRGLVGEDGGLDELNDETNLSRPSP